MLRWLCLGWLSSGCLERVTGEVVPLDERFTAQQESSSGQLGDTGASIHEHSVVEHQVVMPPMPFEDEEGERVKIAGIVVSDVSGPVDLDVSSIDSSAESGLVSEGKVIFPAPGDFELEIPVSVGSLQLSAFQDIEKDGPTDEDPYAEVSVEVGTENIAGIEIVLVQGGRSQAMTGGSHEQKKHFEAPPGYGSGQAAPPQGQPTAVDLFGDHEGERVLVEGTLNYGGEDVIDLDLFQEDASAPGGRVLLGKLKKFAGPFEIQVPVSVQTLDLEAFVDLTGDGPTGDDPRGSLRGIQVSSGPVSGLVVPLVIPVERPKKTPVDPGGTDLEEEFARTRVKGGEISSEDEGL